MLKILIHVQYQPKSQKAQNKKKVFFLGLVTYILLYYIILINSIIYSIILYHTIYETDSGKELKSLYVYKKTTCFATPISL